MKERLKQADLFGLALVLASLMSYSIRSAWSGYQTVACIVGGVLITVSLIVKAGDIRRNLGRRSTQFGLHSAGSVILLVGILALINYLGFNHKKAVDMTAERLHSLADQSVKVTTQLPENVHVKVFYPRGEYAPVREALQLYADINSKLTFEFIDPDKQPQLAQQDKVTNYGEMSNPSTGETLSYGTLIFEMAGRKERVEKQAAVPSEEDITNALIKLVKGEKKTVYFMEGHGEKLSSGTDPSGYSLAVAELENQGYLVKTLNLKQEGKVPADASVLVMDGPKVEPFADESTLLDAYLRAGGSVLLLLDPPPSASLQQFTSKWSIDVGDDFIVDATGGAGPQVPLVTSYGDQQITHDFRVMTFFPLARSVSAAPVPAEGVKVEQLLASSARSWGESDMKSRQASFDEGKDLKGPVPLAMVATKDLGNQKSARLIVYGDSDFASNAYFGAQGNGNLFTNTVVWLAQDESFVAIKAKSPGNRPLSMTEAQGRFVSYVVVLLLPGSFLVAGVSMWMKRRK